MSAIWNSLPSSTRSATSILTFCSRLKTRLLAHLLTDRAYNGTSDPTLGQSLTFNGCRITTPYKFFIVLNCIVLSCKTQYYRHNKCMNFELFKTSIASGHRLEWQMLYDRGWMRYCCSQDGRTVLLRYLLICCEWRLT